MDPLLTTDLKFEILISLLLWKVKLHLWIVLLDMQPVAKAVKAPAKKDESSSEEEDEESDEEEAVKNTLHLIFCNLIFWSCCSHIHCVEIYSYRL